MPAGVFTPGPIEHYVTLPGGAAPVYLGTAVLAPDQEYEDYKIPVLNDLGGRSVPFQLVQDGEQWIVSTTLNRFDMDVMRLIRSLPSRGPGQAPIFGGETGLARGTLVLGLNDFQLILVNSYAGTLSAGSGAISLAAARGFYSATILKYGESTKGTRVLEASLIIQCNNIFHPTTRGFSQFTEGPVGIPAAT